MDVEEALSEVFAAAKFPRRDPPEETTSELVGEAARKAIEEGPQGFTVQAWHEVADAGAGDGLPLDLGKVREIQRAMGGSSSSASFANTTSTTSWFRGPG